MDTILDLALQLIIKLPTWDLVVSKKILKFIWKIKFYFDLEKYQLHIFVRPDFIFPRLTITTYLNTWILKHMWKSTYILVSQRLIEICKNINVILLMKFFWKFLENTYFPLNIFFVLTCYRWVCYVKMHW